MSRKYHCKFSEIPFSLYQIGTILERLDYDKLTVLQGTPHSHTLLVETQIGVIYLEVSIVDSMPT